MTIATVTTSMRSPRHMICNIKLSHGKDASSSTIDAPQNECELTIPKFPFVLLSLCPSSKTGATAKEGKAPRLPKTPTLESPHGPNRLTTVSHPLATSRPTKRSASRTARWRRVFVQLGLGQR